MNKIFPQVEVGWRNKLMFQINHFQSLVLKKKNNPTLFILAVFIANF